MRTPPILSRENYNKLHVSLKCTFTAVKTFFLDNIYVNGGVRAHGLAAEANGTFSAHFSSWKPARNVKSFGLRANAIKVTFLLLAFLHFNVRLGVFFLGLKFHVLLNVFGLVVEGLGLRYFERRESEQRGRRQDRLLRDVGCWCHFARRPARR